MQALRFTRVRALRSNIMPLTKFVQSLRKFCKRTDGASGIEYALVAAMVAVALVTFVPTISSGVTSIFNKINTTLNAPAGGNSSGGTSNP